MSCELVTLEMHVDIVYHSYNEGTALNRSDPWQSLKTQVLCSDNRHCCEVAGGRWGFILYRWHLS